MGNSLRLLIRRRPSSPSAESVSVRASSTRASTEAVAAQDVEDYIKDGDDDLQGRMRYNAHLTENTCLPLL